MKNSGIEWIGEIPENWEVVKLKTYFIDRSGGSWGDEAKNDDNDRICIRVADFDFEKQRVKDSNEKTVRNYTQDIINKLSISEGALLIEKSGGGEKTPVGRCILPIGYEKCLYANFIDKLQIRVINNFRFTAYLMKSLYQNNITCPYIKQTTGIQNLDITALLSENIIRAPIDEQQKIADYLDKRCENIDGLVELQNRMIEKLKEYKQSVITEAVTKGLDPAAKMKNSGVEWIGEIPENWEVNYFSCLFSEHKERNEGMKETNLLSLSYGKIVRKNIDDNEGLLPMSFETYNVVYKDNIIFRLTDLQNDKRSLRTALCKEKGIITSAYIAVKLKENEKSNYMQYLFHSYDVCKVFYGLGAGIRQGMNYKDLKKMPVLIPPIDEQQKIADYLDAKCAEIDRIIEIKQKKIKKLQDYKKSLIYECVTGKREIS